MASKKPAGMLLIEKMKDIAPPPDLPKNYGEILAYYLGRIQSAYNQREQNYPYFDYRTFQDDFQANQEALLSVLRPKINDSDVRVNTGTAEKRIELTLTELLSMNFQPEVRAYDKDSMEMRDLGFDLTDMVRMSNRQEKDDDVYVELFQDLLSQRAAFFEERIENNPIEYMVGGEMVRYECYQAVKRRLSPLQVFLGDISIPAYRFQEQPYVCIYERILFSEAPEELTERPNWKYVKPGSPIGREYAPLFKWRMYSTLEAEEVEIITYLSRTPKGLEKQVIANGVMLFDPGHILPEKMRYPIGMVVVKTIPDFAYGKPPLASAKFLQALQNETFVNLIRKFRQGIEPPIAIKKSGKVPTRDMFEPAAVTQGIDPADIKRIVDHNGITSSEFSFLQLVAQKAEEFIGAVSINNQPGASNMTATQIIELQKQAIKMLGLSLLACVRMKQAATYARIDSILCEYTKEIGYDTKKKKKKFRMFEIESGQFPSGDKVKKYIQMVEEFLPEKEMKKIRKWEKKIMKEEKKETRYTFINVAALKQVPLRFDVEVIPEPRESSQFDKVLFQDSLAQIATMQKLTGREIDDEKLVDDFESIWKRKGTFKTKDGLNGSGDPKAQELLQKISALQGAGGAPVPEGMPGGPEMTQGSEQAGDTRATVKRLLNSPDEAVWKRKGGMR